MDASSHMCDRSDALRHLSDLTSHQIALAQAQAQPALPSQQGGRPASLAHVETLWHGLLEGALPASVHLPLHRAAALFMQGTGVKAAWC